MNKMNCTSSLSSSVATAPSHAVDSAIETRDASVARVAKRSLATFNTQLFDIKSFKCTYPRINLYAFHGYDTWLSTAGKVALWAATFCTAGLVAGGLFAYDLFQSRQLKSDNKKKLCHMLDQLVSRVSYTESKLSDMYKKICDKDISRQSVWMNKRDMTVYEDTIDRYVWKEETVKEYLKRLNNDKSLTYEEMCHETMRFIHDELQEDVAKRCKDFAEELAQKVGIQPNDRMQKHNDDIAFLQKEVGHLTEELRYATDKQLSKHARALTQFRLIQTQATCLIKTLEYVDAACQEIKNFSMQKGHDQFKK